jgi:hypothetical protein
MLNMTHCMVVFSVYGSNKMYLPVSLYLLKMWPVEKCKLYLWLAFVATIITAIGEYCFKVEVAPSLPLL